jgi:hypothetical protein
MFAQMLKQAGKWMWRPERVVRVVGCGSVAGGAMARVALSDRLKVLFPLSVP